MFTLFFFGIVAIFLSTFGSLNLLGLTKLQLFLELLVDLLLLAVAMQRMTCKSNFYLYFSPLLFMVLTLFFFQNLWMLGYLFIELFLLLWIVVDHYSRRSLSESLRYTLLLFLAALPVAIVSFIAFPRISFGHASFGFRGNEDTRASFDGTMHLDGGKLDLSKKIIMEVGFENKMPPEEKLYFRGSVLYIPDTTRWKPLPKAYHDTLPIATYATTPMLEKSDDIVIYKVSLYPTYKRWLYLLDLPIEAPKGATINGDFEVLLKKPIDRPQIYAGASALTYRYGSATPNEIIQLSLHADPSKNPRSAKMARRLIERWPNTKGRLKALKRFFIAQNLTYSTIPPPFDYAHFTDNFLFDRKRGYCVHFAAAFATMARLARLPARIVTGYKADYSNRVNNYIAIEERDAHAWVETMIDGAWHRVEPTALATSVETKDSAAAREQATATKTGLSTDEGLSQLDLYLLYTKFQLQTWILHYNRYRQLQLLQEIKEEPLFAAKLLMTISTLVLLLWGVWLYLVNRQNDRQIDKILYPLLKRLKQKGCSKDAKETLFDYLQRCSHRKELPSTLSDIAYLYRKVRFKGEKGKRTLLKREIRSLLRELHQR